MSEYDDEEAYRSGDTQVLRPVRGRAAAPGRTSAPAPTPYGDAGWAPRIVHARAARRRRASGRIVALLLIVPSAVLGYALTVNGAPWTDDGGLGGGTALAAPDTVSVSPTPEVPAGVGNVDDLEPPVRRSIRLAIEAAAADGVELRVTSGWRSREHQARLYAEAIEKYGSPEAARRWVLPPDESEHVHGRAVDVGPEEGAAWLREHGVRFGLCQRYANEPWHFERLAGALGSTCPPLEPHA